MKELVQNIKRAGGGIADVRRIMTLLKNIEIMDSLTMMTTTADVDRQDQ